jgi:hypothetical protein
MLTHFHPGPAPLVLAALFALWAVLFVPAEFGDVSLKPLKSWLAAVCRLWWGLTAFPLERLPRSWRIAVFAAYAGTTMVLGWVKRSHLFESKVKPPRSLAPLLTVPQPTYGDCRWYRFRRSRRSEPAAANGLSVLHVYRRLLWRQLGKWQAHC